MTTTKRCIFMSMLIALNILLGRFICIKTAIIQISFGFITVSLAGYMLGPISAGIIGAVSDVISTILFPQGVYFPGFTLTAFLAGIIYGLAFYKKQINVKRVLLTVVLINIIINSGMNTFLLSILTGKTFVALLGLRTLKNLILIPIQTFLIYVSINRICSTAKANLFNN